MIQIRVLIYVELIPDFMKSLKQRQIELKMQILTCSELAQLSAKGGCCGGTGPPEEEENKSGTGS